jgi:hypothetical protein
MGQYSSRFLSEPLRKLERFTAVTAHPMDSLWRTFLKSLRRVIEFVFRAIQLGPKHKILLRRTRSLKATQGSRLALVLGNGPSIAKLNPVEVSALQKVNLDVFVVNWFPLSELAKSITPNFIVLSDPAMAPSKVSDLRCSQLWDYLSLHSEIKIVVPTSWSRYLDKDLNWTSRTIYFNDLGIEGLSKNINPTKPRGYLSLTVYKALAMASYLGYRDISILGVDNTMFQGLSVTQDNDLMLGDKHFYAKQRPDQNMTNFYPNGVADFFYDISLCFLHLRRCFGHLGNVYNLDGDSLVDCFSKLDRDFLTSTQRFN